MAWLLRHRIRPTHLTSTGAPIPCLRASLPTGSKLTPQRWYTENAVISESNRPVSDTAGSSGTHVDDSAKRDGNSSSMALKKESSAKDSSSSDGKVEQLPPSNDNKETNDKLANLILGKMRGKTNTNGHNESTSQRGAEQQGATKAKSSEDENSKSIQDSKWAQVMSSIRRMAAKNREETASTAEKQTSSRNKESENTDDFADLDLPQGEKSSILKSPVNQTKNSHFNSFKKEYTVNRPKEDRIQGGNHQRGRFPHRSDMLSDRNPADCTGGPSREPFSSMKPGWNKQAGKETKPASFNFLKPNEVNSSSTCVDVANRNSDSVNKAAPPVASKNSIVPYSGFTVCVQNVPLDSNLALVKEALSVHGEIKSCFRKPGSDRLSTVYIEFKAAEAMDSALAARSLRLEGVSVNIVRADLPITTVVRLSKVSADTNENQIISICSRYGSLDTIRRRGNGVYDVFYKVGERPNISKILDSLNEVTLNERRWVALPAPNLHPAVRKEVLSSSEGQAWHASQLKQALQRIETGLDTVLVSFEDLKALTHMEDEVSKR